MIAITTARTRLLGFGMLAAVFLAGGLAGAAVLQVRAAADPPAPEHEKKERDGECRERRDPFAYLELTPEQRARADAIFEERKRQMDAFWDENGARMEMIVDSARAEFRSVLTDAQRAEYDRRRAERDAREERERERRRACAKLQEQKEAESPARPEEVPETPAASGSDR